MLSLWWAAAESPSAPISRRGVHDGVPYRIEVPVSWNGKLVVFAHGYEGEGSGQGSVHTSPLATYLTSQGYAWAASGYRSRGNRPDWFVADTLALRELFIRDIGPPHWTIIHGMSMGGHVAIASLELYPSVYQGALIECGVIDGVSLGDLYVASWAAAEYFSGINLLEVLNRQERARRVYEQWLPLMGLPGAYTERGRRYDSAMKYLLQQMYRRRTLTAGTAHLLVQRAVRWPGHCTFTGEVREQAFDDLVRWIEGGIQPDGDDVLASDVSQIGLRWTPLLHVEDPLRQ